MATDVQVTTNVDTSQGVTSLRSLQKELKNLIAQQANVGKGSADFTKLQNAINTTEGRIGDLTDSFKTLRGSGVERVNSSISLFREGLLNADTEKLKIGLQGIGSAMKAIPIFLLVEGVTLLIQNFDKVAEVFGFAADETARLKREKEALNATIETSILLSNRELKLLKDQEAPLSVIIAKLKEIEELKTSDARRNIALLAKDLALAEAELAKAPKNANRGGILSALFSENQKENLKTKIEELRTQLTQAKNTIIGVQIETEDAIDSETDKANKKALEKRKEHEAKLRQLLEERQDHRRKKLEDEERDYQDSIASRLQAEFDANEEIRLHREALAKAEAEIDKYNAEQSEQKARARRRRDLDNQLAQEKAHQNLSAAEKISAIEKLRNQELANEQLTVDQRVAIIKKGEADILAVRTASTLQNLELTKQYTQVLSSLNDFQNQQQLQDLRELETEKNLTIENERTRSEEAIDKEKENTDALLSNSRLTNKQREKIKIDSENRINLIEYESKKAQIEAENAFQKKQLEIKKQQFEKEKALKIVNIAIDTASALVKTTAELGGVGALTPPGIALLAGITALGISQAAVVASQKFDDSGFSATALPAPPKLGGGGSSGPSSDITPERTPTQFNPSAIINTGKTGVNKVIVLEKDIRDTMEKVDVLEERATFGF